jgi:hypothetical protein
MNIIFDEKLAQQLAEKYTVLELDTIMQPELTQPVKLFAVVEITNVQDITTLSFMRELHVEMIAAYKSGDWQRTQELVAMLLGQFGGELDEFYNLVIDFAAESLKTNAVWDGIKHTIPKENIEG